MVKTFLSSLIGIGVDYYEANFGVFVLQDEDIALLKEQREVFKQLLMDKKYPDHFAFNTGSFEVFNGDAGNFDFGDIVEIASRSGNGDANIETFKTTNDDLITVEDVKSVRIENEKVEFNDYYIWFVMSEKYSNIILHSQSLRWEDLD